MAELRGTLRVAASESRINAVLQAICGDPVDPIRSATDFLAGLGFVDGDELVVSGGPGAIGNVPVFCVQGASRSDEDLILGGGPLGIRETSGGRARPATTARKAGAKPAARTKAARKTKKSAAKRVTKKAIKKVAKKAGKKRAKAARQPAELPIARRGKSAKSGRKGR